MNTFSHVKNSIKGILICLVFIIAIPDGVAQDKLKKEKKIITAFIKSEYATWAGADLQRLKEASQPIVHPSINSAKGSESIEKTANKVSTKFVAYNTDNLPESPQKFSDFEFTIVDHQAIVQFTVDNKMISAFLEKENGTWKLVCAAHLDKIL